MAPYAPQSRRIRKEWLATEEGRFAQECIEMLLGKLLSGWPRRSRSLLVLNAGSGQMLEMLWQAGFDITAQDDDPEFLSLARESVHRHIDFILSAPDHIPLNDCSFDYAVAVAALEFWENPESVFEELNRVACSGIILIFPNSLSVCAGKRLWGEPHPLFHYPDARLPSAKTVWSLLNKCFGKKNKQWTSTLVGPCFTWQPRFARFNSILSPIPLGAVLGVRVDFGPMCVGTPLLLHATEPVTSAE